MSAWALRGKVGSQPVTFHQGVWKVINRRKLLGDYDFQVTEVMMWRKLYMCFWETHFLGIHFWLGVCWQEILGDLVLGYFIDTCLSSLLKVFKFVSLTVATILLTAAADSSSPLGCSTIVTPRYLRWKTMPSNRVSLVSVQFSGSSARWEKCTSDTYAHQQTFCFTVRQAERILVRHVSVKHTTLSVSLCKLNYTRYDNSQTNALIMKV